MASPFASMRFFNYRLWFGGSLVSSTAVWLQRVAQDWYVLTVLTDHDSSQVGIVTALQFLPILGLSGFAGALADRVKGRRILQSSLLGVCLVSLCMGVLILTGVCNVWHMYALAVASGVIIAIDTPARQAFVGELVPRTYMANAVALNATAFHAARLIGPAVSSSNGTGSGRSVWPPPSSSSSRSSQWRSCAQGSWSSARSSPAPRARCARHSPTCAGARTSASSCCSFSLSQPWG